MFDQGFLLTISFHFFFHLAKVRSGAVKHSPVTDMDPARGLGTFILKRSLFNKTVKTVSSLHISHFAMTLFAIFAITVPQTVPHYFSRFLQNTFHYPFSETLSYTPAMSRTKKPAEVRSLISPSQPVCLATIKLELYYGVEY